MSCSACRSAGLVPGSMIGANAVERTGEEDDRREAEQRDDERARSSPAQSAAHAPADPRRRAGPRHERGGRGRGERDDHSQPPSRESVRERRLDLLERDRGEGRDAGDQAAGDPGRERRAAEARAARRQRQEHAR